LVVKVPAMTASASETMRAISFRPGFLIAASAVEKRKPFGPRLFVNFDMV